jgi:hypothetical protein
MSTTPSSTSYLQILSNAGLLPSSLSTTQLENAPPGEVAQLAIVNIESAGLASLFGVSASSIDSVSLSDNAAATLLGESTSSETTPADALLQALATSTSGMDNAASTSASSPAISAADAEQAAIASLLDYTA